MFYNHNIMSRKQTIAIFSALLTALALSTTLGGFAVTSASTAEQNQGFNSIGASTMADKAFSPNPVNVKVGDTVTWTNDDSQPHTVVSGSGFRVIRRWEKILIHHPISIHCSCQTNIPAQVYYCRRNSLFLRTSPYDGR